MTKVAKTAPKAASAPVKVRLPLLGSVKAINLAIADMKTRADLLQADMHILACSVLKHVATHNDIRVLNNFLKNVPDMVRLNSLKTWFETFGNIEIKDGVPAAVHSKKAKLGDAMAKPFWKFKALEGAPYVPLVMDTYLDQQIKRLEKDAKETKSTVNASLIKALKDHKAALAAGKAPTGN